MVLESQAQLYDCWNMFEIGNVPWPFGHLMCLGSGKRGVSYMKIKTNRDGQVWLLVLTRVPREETLVSRCGEEVKARGKGADGDGEGRRPHHPDIRWPELLAAPMPIRTRFSWGQFPLPDSLALRSGHMT